MIVSKTKTILKKKMTYLKYNVGDLVRITVPRGIFTTTGIPLQGVVKTINGEYHYVDVSFDNQVISMELYRNEIEIVCKSNLPDDLFEL